MEEGVSYPDHILWLHGKKSFEEGSVTDDTPDIAPAQVAIVDPHGKVLNESAKPVRRPKSKDSDFVTRGDIKTLVEKINDAITTATLAVGDKAYEQMSEEAAEHFEVMEKAITRHVIEYFESRTIRGRVKRWWREHVTKPKPSLVVDAVDALDPNVHAESRAIDHDNEEERIEAMMGTARRVFPPAVDDR